MRISPWIPVTLLAALLAAGCGGTSTVPEGKDKQGKDKESASTSKGKGDKGSDKKAGNTEPAAPTLEGLLKEAPKTTLIKHTFHIGKVEFTIDGPKGVGIDASAAPAVRILFDDNSGVEIAPRSAVFDVAGQKKWWEGRKQPKFSKFLLETPDTLVVETVAEAGHRYGFVTNQTISHIDLGARFIRRKGGNHVVGAKPDVLLALKCARSLATKETVPSDPAQALQKLGATLKREGDKVTSVLFHEPTVTRSTLELVARLPTVKTVDLSWISASGDDFAVLEKLSDLDDASFAHNEGLGNAGLAHLGKLKKLRKLDLEHTGITAAGLKHLEGLKELRWLKLDRNDLSGSGTEALAALTALDYLHLYGTKVGDEALNAIGKLPRLRTLNLEDCPVTDAGLAHLKGLAELETLELQNTRVSDDGLANLEGLKKLKAVNLRKTRVTAKGVEKLQKALPSARIDGR
jgi:hypothetical protein